MYLHVKWHNYKLSLNCRRSEIKSRELTYAYTPQTGHNIRHVVLSPHSTPFGMGTVLLYENLTFREVTYVAQRPHTNKQESWDSNTFLSLKSMLLPRLHTSPILFSELRASKSEEDEKLSRNKKANVMSEIWRMQLNLKWKYFNVLVYIPYSGPSLSIVVHLRSWSWRKSIWPAHSTETLQCSMMEHHTLTFILCHARWDICILNTWKS